MTPAPWRVQARHPPHDQHQQHPPVHYTAGGSAGPASTTPDHYIGPPALGRHLLVQNPSAPRGSTTTFQSPSDHPPLMMFHGGADGREGVGGSTGTMRHHAPADVVYHHRPPPNMERSFPPPQQAVAPLMRPGPAGGSAPVSDGAAPFSTPSMPYGPPRQPFFGGAPNSEPADFSAQGVAGGAHRGQRSSWPLLQHEQQDQSRTGGYQNLLVHPADSVPPHLLPPQQQHVQDLSSSLGDASVQTLLKLLSTQQQASSIPVAQTTTSSFHHQPPDHTNTPQPPTTAAVLELLSKLQQQQRTEHPQQAAAPGPDFAGGGSYANHSNDGSYANHSSEGGYGNGLIGENYRYEGTDDSYNSRPYDGSYRPSLESSYRSRPTDSSYGNQPKELMSDATTSPSGEVDADAGNFLTSFLQLNSASQAALLSPPPQSSALQLSMQHGSGALHPQEQTIPEHAGGRPSPLDVQLRTILAKLSEQQQRHSPTLQHPTPHSREHMWVSKSPASQQRQQPCPHGATQYGDGRPSQATNGSSSFSDAARTTEARHSSFGSSRFSDRPGQDDAPRGQESSQQLSRGRSRSHGREQLRGPADRDHSRSRGKGIRSGPVSSRSRWSQANNSRPLSRSPLRGPPRRESGRESQHQSGGDSSRRRGARSRGFQGHFSEAPQEAMLDLREQLRNSRDTSPKGIDSHRPAPSSRRPTVVPDTNRDYRRGPDGGGWDRHKRSPPSSLREPPSLRRRNFERRPADGDLRVNQLPATGPPPCQSTRVPQPRENAGAVLSKRDGVDLREMLSSEEIQVAANEKLIATKTAGELKKQQALFAPWLIHDIKEYTDDGSTARLDSNLPPQWVVSALAALKAVGQLLHDHLVGANLLRLAERCTPGVLIIGLPNVNANILHREINNHFKAHRVHINRVVLPVYPYTGLSMGWGIIEPSYWKATVQLFTRPQFQWRGISCRIYPLLSPQFLQLNASLSLNSLRVRGAQGALDVSDWTMDDFTTFSKAMIPQAFADLRRINETVDRQASTLNSPVPMLVVTSNRKLQLSVPSSAPLLSQRLPDWLPQKQPYQPSQFILPPVLFQHATLKQAVTVPPALSEVSPRAVGQVFPPLFLSAPNAQAGADGTVLTPVVSEVEQKPCNSETSVIMVVKPLCVQNAQPLLRNSSPDSSQDNIASAGYKKLSQPMSLSNDLNNPQGNFESSSSDQTFDEPNEAADVTMSEISYIHLPTSTPDESVPALAPTHSTMVETGEASPAAVEFSDGYDQETLDNTVECIDKLLARDVDNGNCSELPVHKDDSTAVPTTPQEVSGDDVVMEVGVDGDMDLSRSDDENESRKQKLTPEQPTSSSPQKVFLLPTPEAVSWLPHQSSSSSAPLLSTPLMTVPGTLSRAPGRAVVTQLSFPIFSSFSVGSDSVIVRTISKEDEMGFLSLFSFGNHSALAVQYLLDLFTKYNPSFKDSTPALEVAPWILDLERHGLDVGSLRESLESIIPFVNLPNLPAFEELPYFLTIRHVPNFKAHEILELIRRSVRSRIPVASDSEDFWGLFCYKFAETGRLRDDGLLLLPSSITCRSFVSQIANNKQATSCFIDVPGLPFPCPVELKRVLMDQKIIDEQLTYICEILTDITKDTYSRLSQKFSPLSQHLLSDPDWENVLPDGSALELRSEFFALAELATQLGHVPRLSVPDLSQNSSRTDSGPDPVASPPWLDCRHSICSVQHILETYFFSVERFFKTPILARMLDVVRLTPASPAAVVPARVIKVTPALQTRLAEIANHALPKLSSCVEKRAACIFLRTAALLKADDVLLDPNHRPVSGPLCLEGKELERGVDILVVDALNAYIEVVQWLIFENEPDWQATLRVPAISSTVAGSTASVPFELTGDICSSSVEAKICCALSCLRYLADVEEQMLRIVWQMRLMCVTQLEITEKDIPNVVFEEVTPAAATSTENITAQVGVTQLIPHAIACTWRDTQAEQSSHTISLGRARSGLSGPLPTDYYSDQPKWTAAYVRQLQQEGSFRFVPLENVVSTPQHKYEMEHMVQTRVRSNEKSFKWATHDLMFKEDEAGELLIMLREIAAPADGEEAECTAYSFHVVELLLRVGDDEFGEVAKHCRFELRSLAAPVQPKARLPVWSKTSSCDRLGGQRCMLYKAVEPD